MYVFRIFGLMEALKTRIRLNGLLDIRNYRIATMSGYSKRGYKRLTFSKGSCGGL
jgi:hypothetical protein